MCFSATASFVASGVIGTVGIATLSLVREPRALLFAAVPMLFAVHQFTEGWVWLGLEGRIGPVAFGHVTFLFMLYAHVILPLLMPLAILLIEPAGWRRFAILGLTAAGAIVFAFDLYGLVAFPSVCEPVQNSIAYRNPVVGELWQGILYVAATSGAMLMSSHRVIRWYGVINVVAIVIAEFVKEHAFASVWCFYAAIMSVMIYWHFRRQAIDGESPNSDPVRA